MKKILLFFYIITLISCNENKIKEQIEKQFQHLLQILQN